MSISALDARLRVPLRALTSACRFAALLAAAPAPAQGPPAAALGPAQLAVIVNDDDPNSVAVAAHYREARGIPSANMVHVRIPGRPRKLSAAQFATLKADIDRQLGPDIQAVAMLWTAPYAVECNAITAAYTLGFDASLCAKTCGPGKISSYFNAAGAKPYTERGMRLAMLLPTDSVEQARDLIARGVASGFRAPAAGAYYLATGETARNSRAPYFPRAGAVPQRRLTIHVRRAETLEDARDIMVYQTGKASVDKLETLGFLPGALADHLTSFGGDLYGTAQMSSLRWLEAGATASYGTVSEPCNYWQKFPHPTVLLSQYLRGATAIEAYWKSVAWPGQGLFIGEPLAAPYRAAPYRAAR
ncbi:TIGR03790 family protein [Pseudoduganella namucuonensis]|uniref:TIGR03790 family protein n=1 Tax=Pseudoduganella namucuonensis TaxID=1035707 RepID=A0A1I7LY03_9BURK|nr:TIGR03790 family protein [Pseudoduganella namucuonensis]SFV14601.1 TIGR03790 family protein [Pseudoduganella namucuonensis]